MDYEILIAINLEPDLIVLTQIVQKNSSKEFVKISEEIQRVLQIKWLQSRKCIVELCEVT